MVAKKQTKKNKREELISRYMEYLLEEGNRPSSVFKFCKSYKFKEEEFYSNFGSFKGLQNAIWDTFFDRTIELLQQNKEYDSFRNKDKMLSFFYTFFELLTLNRSYVLLSLDEGTLDEMAAQFKSPRKRIKSFALDLIENANEESNSRLGKRNPIIFSEGAWWHFLFLLKFWADDNSPAFEKTDMAIEKSVNTVFDLFDNTPLESIMDFGKFLYKENFA